MRHRSTVIIMLVSAVLAAGVVFFPGGKLAIRGSLLTHDEIAMQLKESADTDSNFILTIREIRRGLGKVIRDTATGVPSGDINGDGSVTRSDLTSALQAFRALLAAECGNTQEEAGEQCDDGNQNDSDNCTNVCREATPPASGLGTLSIELRTLGDTVQSTVLGRAQLPVLAFAVTARNHGINLQTMTFQTSNDTLANAAYGLWRDTDADGRADTKIDIAVKVDSLRDQFTVTSIDPALRLIAADTTVVFELRADIARTLTSQHLLRMMPATRDPAYVTATDADEADARLSGIATDGVCSDVCHITVDTAASAPLFYIQNQGSLIVGKDPEDFIPPHILIRGALSPPILHLRFLSRLEPIELMHVEIMMDNPGSADAARSIDRLELSHPGEETPFADAAVDTCDAAAVPDGTFCVDFDPGEFIVPADEARDVIVRARIQSETDGAVSGDWLIPKIRSTLLDHVVRARGLTSLNELPIETVDGMDTGELIVLWNPADTSANPTGKINVIGMTSIGRIENASPDPDDTAIGAGVSSIGQFRFAASDNVNGNKATLQGLIFTVELFNAEVDAASFRLFNAADSTAQVPCHAANDFDQALNGAATGLMFVRCDGLESGALNAEIEAGSEAVFVLQATVLNPRMTGSLPSSLQVSLEHIVDVMNQFPPVFSREGSHLLWSDGDDAHGADFFWTDIDPAPVRSTLYRN